MFAAKGGHDVSALIEAGADVDQENFAECDTALIISCLYDHPECALALIEAGADLEAETPYEATSLILACECGHSQCAQILISAGADVDATDENGQTALNQACSFGHEECAHLLIDAGATLKNWPCQDAVREFSWMHKRRMKYLWRVVQRGVRARGIAWYWLGSTMKRQHAPEGRGRKRDLEDFEKDCVELL
jgi:hypothetical protein